jgi:integrase
LPDAHKHDLIDLVDVLTGLGCHIGELLALDWTKVDAEAGTLRIEGTVIRVPGEGLIVQPHTKPKADMRTIHPPGWVLDLFRRRHGGCATSCGGHHGRACTRMRSDTLATQLNRAGLSAREIADYLGHERISMTQDVYMSRQTTGVAAAAALGRLGPNESAG